MKNRMNIPIKPVLAAAILLAAHIPAMALAQWGSDIRLTDDGPYRPYPSGISTNGAGIAVDKDMAVHIVWYGRDQTAPNNDEIWYNVSTDSGESWRYPSRGYQLTENSGKSVSPAIAVSGSTVYVVWHDNTPGNNEIFLRKKSDETWSDLTRLTSDPGDSRWPVVAAFKRIVHVIWRDDRGGVSSVYYKRSPDAGMTWSDDIKALSSDSNAMPHIAVFGTHVHIVSTKTVEGHRVINYTRSTDDGKTFEPEIILATSEHHAQEPAIAAIGGFVHLVWQDNLGYPPDSEGLLFYKRSANYGEDWSPPALLSTGGRRTSELPFLAVSGSNVYLVCDDYRHGRPYFPNDEIYFTFSEDNGEKWGPETRLTFSECGSGPGHVAIGGTTVHVLFTDIRDYASDYCGSFSAPSEIYYKQNPAGILR